MFLYLFFITFVAAAPAYILSARRDRHYSKPENTLANSDVGDIRCLFPSGWISLLLMIISTLFIYISFPLLFVHLNILAFNSGLDEISGALLFLGWSFVLIMVAGFGLQWD